MHWPALLTSSKLHGDVADASWAWSPGQQQQCAQPCPGATEGPGGEPKGPAAGPSLRMLLMSPWRICCPSPSSQVASAGFTTLNRSLAPHRGCNHIHPAMAGCHSAAAAVVAVSSMARCPTGGVEASGGLHIQGNVKTMCISHVRTFCMHSMSGQDLPAPATADQRPEVQRCKLGTVQAPPPRQPRSRPQPKHWAATPAGVLIPRSRMFYCASFARRGGLPSKREVGA